MGDFNLRGSKEPLYQLLTATDDTAFRYSDPPFSPDSAIKYPASWDHDGNYAAYFTTSTRESPTVPNSCGSGGGAKGWYDHIFLSKWLVNNTNHMRYIPHSYKTIGNDGKRFRIGINNANTAINNAAPPEVLEALYRMSNKYPVMLSLEVEPSTTGPRPANPEKHNEPVFKKEEVTILENPVKESLALHFTEGMLGQDLTLICFDKDKAEVMRKDIKVEKGEMEVKCKLKKGTFTLRVLSEHSMVGEMKFEKG